MGHAGWGNGRLDGLCAGPLYCPCVDTGACRRPRGEARHARIRDGDHESAVQWIGAQGRMKLREADTAFDDAMHQMLGRLKAAAPAQAIATVD